MTYEVDQITFEEIKNALGTLADEMALVIMRTAYSEGLRATMDYSTAMCDANGRFVAQGLTNPIHLGSFPDAMRRLVEEPHETTQRGDVVIFNDPYGSGGMHLPDIFIFQPLNSFTDLFSCSFIFIHPTNL